MRHLSIAAFLVSTALGQTVVSPVDIAAAVQRLEPHDGDRILRCDLNPTKPALTFGLRFRAGYRLEIPLIQFSGVAQELTVTLRITPEGGQPVYLTGRIDLPSTTHPELTAETSGSFLAGEGRYHAELALSNGSGGVCRKQWAIAAVKEPGERSVPVTIPPNTVADLSYSSPASPGAPGPPNPRHLTILMNSSKPYRPPNRGFSDAYADYRADLVAMLAATLETLPGTAVRLVVFDLDRQSESLRQDGFTLQEIDKAERAADDIEHAVVSVSELQNRPGRWGMLSNLIRGEIAGPGRADVILFVGARLDSAGEIPAHFLDAERHAGARFLYLQYFPAREITAAATPVIADASISRSRSGIPSPGMRLGPNPLDPIELAVERLKGKTISVHSPLDFVKVIETLQRR
jgi:hypothetical protein